MTKIKVDGKEYNIKKLKGYELTKVVQGLDEADAVLKLIVKCVQGITEKAAKELDSGPYLKLSAELQTILGIRESDIKKLHS